MYLPFGVSISSLFCECNSSECDFLEDFDALVILSAILLPIKSPAAYAVFSIDLFNAVFIESVIDFAALSRSF